MTLLLFGTNMVAPGMIGWVAMLLPLPPGQPIGLIAAQILMTTGV